MEDDTFGAIGTDILSDLVRVGLGSMAEEILEYLDLHDLKCCQLVCRIWFQVVNGLWHHHEFQRVGPNWANGIPKVSEIQCTKQRSVCTVSSMALDERSLLCGLAGSGIIEFIWSLAEAVPISGSDQYTHELLTPSLTLEGHEDEVNCVKFAHPWVISGSSDTTVRVWSLETAVCVAVLRGHVGKIWCLDADRHRIVSGGRHGQTFIWSLSEAVEAEDGAPRDRPYEECQYRALQTHSKTTAVGQVRIDRALLVSADDPFLPAHQTQKMSPISAILFGLVAMNLAVQNSLGSPLFLGQGGVKESEAATNYFSERFGSGFLARLAALQGGVLSSKRGHQDEETEIADEREDVKTETSDDYPKFQTGLPAVKPYRTRLVKVVKKARKTQVVPVFVDHTIEAESEDEAASSEAQSENIDAPKAFMNEDDIESQKEELMSFDIHCVTAFGRLADYWRFNYEVPPPKVPVNFAQYHPIITGGVNGEPQVAHGSPFYAHVGGRHAARFESAHLDEAVRGPRPLLRHSCVRIFTDLHLDLGVQESVRGMLGIAAHKLVPGEGRRGHEVVAQGGLETAQIRIEVGRRRDDLDESTGHVLRKIRAELLHHLAHELKVGLGHEHDDEAVVELLGGQIVDHRREGHAQIALMGSTHGRNAQDHGHRGARRVRGRLEGRLEGVGRVEQMGQEVVDGGQAQIVGPVGSRPQGSAHRAGTE
eukprot:maker-scaffold20_size707684-snap-gene-3.11 protein:Tk03846 transcript:maker-scaffold20_size707684-snap-gene-3.11-mRNA-1 annotation:"f box:wd repeat containing protein 1a"